MTLKLDKNTIARAKEYAVSQKISLSKLIENYLDALTRKEETEAKISPFVKSITGNDKIKDKRDWKEQREDYINYLEEKYK